MNDALEEEMSVDWKFFMMERLKKVSISLMFKIFINFICYKQVYLCTNYKVILPEDE